MKSWFAILFFGLACPVVSKAELRGDLSVQAQARSYPLSGSLDLDAGASYKLWGEQDSPWLGFTRLGLMSSHAGLYNSGEVAVEIFPVGFLGFKAGYEFANNESSYGSFDCSLYECYATWEKRFVEAQLAFKFKGLFLISRGSLSEVDYDRRSERALILPGVGLPVSPEGERFRNLTVMLGYEINDQWQYLILLRDDLAVDQNMSTESRYLVVRWLDPMGFKGVSAQLGAGVVNSDIFAKHASIIGGLRWQIKPSFKLF